MVFGKLIDALLTHCPKLPNTYLADGTPSLLQH